MHSTSCSLDLEQLKHQAKALLRAYRARDARARQRIATHLPRFVADAPARGRREFVLADAMLVVAREHGFASWPRLKAFVQAATSSTSSVAFAGMDAQQRSPDTLAAQLAELAVARDAAGLAREFSRLPLRDIMAVRRIVVERGAYTELVDALLAGLRHPNARVRHDCAHALDHFADDRCVEPLRRLLDDPVPRVRRVALHVLSCAACKLAPLPTGDDLVARVIGHAQRDASINVRRHAVIALGSFRDDPRAREALCLLSSDARDPAILRYARQALWHASTIA